MITEAFLAKVGLSLAQANQIVEETGLVEHPAVFEAYLFSHADPDRAMTDYLIRLLEASDYAEASNV
jgi:hypothetical protein